ncbi:MAG: PEP-CTERM sorting domain-containing protein [Cyanophyceae cyanobacterium]
MIKSYKNLLRLLTGAVVLYAGSASAASFMDEFVDPTNPNQFIRADAFESGNDTAFSETADFPDTILGGYRDLYLEIESREDVSPQSGAAADVFDGIMRFNNDTGIKSKLQLTYDGQDNSSELDTMGLEGLDLTADGATGFGLNIIEADRNPFFITAAIYSGDQMSSVTLDFNEEIIDDGTPREAFFAFDQFEGIDLTDVGAVQFTFEGPDALDMRVGPITMAEEVSSAEIPEPTSLLALAGVSALGVSYRRRKCKS